MLAAVRARSRPFAQTTVFGFPSKRANASEPERTLNLAILATESTAFLDELREPGRKLPDLRLILTMTQDPGWNEEAKSRGISRRRLTRPS
jgi:hypothetical protein